MIFAHACIVLTPSRQGCIATARKGSVTSPQTVYVPADDPMDPASAANFAHLDAAVSSHPIAELGIHPVVDRLDSKSRMLNVEPPHRKGLAVKGCKQVGHGTLQGYDCYKEEFFGITKVFGSWKGNGFFPTINHT